MRTPVAYAPGSPSATARRRPIIGRMGEPVVALPSFAELCEYVRAALCAADALDPAQTPFFRAVAKKAGRPWGVVFHVEGPRRVRPSAVWAAAADRITFYDAAGKRTREVKLSEAPEL